MQRKCAPRKLRKLSYYVHIICILFTKWIFYDLANCSIASKKLNAKIHFLIGLLISQLSTKLWIYFTQSQSQNEWNLEKIFKFKKVSALNLHEN